MSLKGYDACNTPTPGGADSYGVHSFPVLGTSKSIKNRQRDTDVIKINITMSFTGSTSVMRNHALQVGPT